MILQLPLGAIYFSVFITLIALWLCGIAIPILQLGFDIPVDANGDSYYLAGRLLLLMAICSPRISSYFSA